MRGKFTPLCGAMLVMAMFVLRGSDAADVESGAVLVEPMSHARASLRPFGLANAPARTRIGSSPAPGAFADTFSRCMHEAYGDAGLQLRRDVLYAGQSVAQSKFARCFGQAFEEGRLRVQNVGVAPDEPMGSPVPDTFAGTFASCMNELAGSPNLNPIYPGASQGDTKVLTCVGRAVGVAVDQLDPCNDQQMTPIEGGLILCAMFLPGINSICLGAEVGLLTYQYFYC